MQTSTRSVFYQKNVLILVKSLFTQTMKKLATLLILALTCSAFTPLLAQKANKKDEQFKETKALIESGRYEFIVQSVQPTGARTVHPSSTYTMKVKDNTFNAHLPYFGRVYQPTMGGSGGITFDGTPENLEISLNEKKRMVNVKFRIQGEHEKYELYLSVGSSGYASLNATSQKRQTITYSGIISPLKAEKK
jgi:hypothetical protein